MKKEENKKRLIDMNTQHTHTQIAQTASVVVVVVLRQQ